MLVRGTNGLEIEVEDQVATAMIAAGIVEAVTDGTEPVEDIEAVEDVEDPEPAPAKTKK
ncbi:hypothetical protein XHP1_00008 [Actinomyces phage xhp1]|uniref:hypothetical protein n=1 Tax=Schaalia odontolytica TaxID=1660 RepID=UPI000AB6AFE3|nr:hypothetical protein [Schaalia odontolytica]AVJ50945.1 hypothetical protein XHP1_00008 [Actinomyces phage xhp1]